MTETMKITEQVPLPSPKDATDMSIGSFEKNIRILCSLHLRIPCQNRGVYPLCGRSTSHCAPFRYENRSKVQNLNRGSGYVLVSLDSTTAAAPRGICYSNKHIQIVFGQQGVILLKSTYLQSPSQLEQGFDISQCLCPFFHIIQAPQMNHGGMQHLIDNTP